MRTTYHHGHLREELIRLGEQEISTSGLDHFGLRELARQAGVSIGAVFRHFKDKDDLVRSIALQGFQVLLQDLQGGDGFPSQERVHRGFRSYVQFALVRSGCLRCMFGGVLERSEPESEVVLLSTRTFEWLVDAVRAGQADGWIRMTPPEKIALAWFSALHGASILQRELGTFPILGRLSALELADLLFETQRQSVAPN